MTDFKPEDQDTIALGSPLWKTIDGWIQMNLTRLRDQRETGADLRELDTALGSIIMLKALLDLPAQIKQARTREPVTGDDFGIPGYDTDNDWSK